MKNIQRAVALITVALFVASLSFYTGPAIADTNGKLVAEYKFASDANDTTGNGHDGTVMGNVSFANDSPLGQCAVFNGGSVQVANSSDLGLTQLYTISAWVKVDQQSNMSSIESPLISKTEDTTENNGDNSTYAAYGQGDGLFTMSMNYYKGPEDGYTNQYTAAYNINLTSGWSLVTLTNDGTNMYNYINGELKDTKPVPSGIPAESSTGNVIIGGDREGGSDVYLKGRVADLRIYNYALNNDEITALYKTASQGPSQTASTGYADTILLFLNNPIMNVDGAVMEIDPGRGTMPISINGRTMVPIGALIKAMGGTVNWNEADRSLTVSLKGQTVKMVLDSTTAYVNGVAVTMDVPPQPINGRTMVPLRFVSEQLGCKVLWDSTAQQITILFNK